MEHHRNQHEKTKYDEGKNQPTQHSFHPYAHQLLITSDLYTCPDNLREETDDIVYHKYCSQPLRPDTREMFCIECTDYPTENHVYSSGDEGRRAEDEDLLEGPGPDFRSVFVGPRASIIAECFA